MRKGILIIFLTISIVVSFFISTAFSFVSITKLVRQSDKEENTIIAHQIESSIVDTLTSQLNISKSMDNDFLRDICKNINNYTTDELSDSVGSFLSNYVNNFGFSTGFFVDNTKHYYFSESGFIKVVDLNNDDDRWYLDFLKSNKSYELNVDNDQANRNRITIFVNYLLKDTDGTILGVCGVGVSVASINSFINSISENHKVDIDLVDSDGVVCVSSDETRHNLLASEKELSLMEYYYENIKDASLYSLRENNNYYFVTYISNCDWYLFINDSVDISDSSITLIVRNILACVFTLLSLLAIVIIFVRFEEKRASEFKLKSELDALTGLGNRLAYESNINKLRNSDEFKNITVFVFDINRLKYVNDHFGHSYGDKQIIESAKMLAEVFDRIGKVYRTGGDEYIVICNETLNCDDIITNLLLLVKKYNGSDEIELSLSYGYASGSENIYINYDEIFKSADRRMYECKTKYYQANNLHR